MTSQAALARYNALNEAYFLALPISYTAAAAIRHLLQPAHEAYLLAWNEECNACRAALSHSLPTLTDEDAPKYQVAYTVTAA